MLAHSEVNVNLGGTFAGSIFYSSIFKVIFLWWYAGVRASLCLEPGVCQCPCLTYGYHDLTGIYTSLVSFEVLIIVHSSTSLKLKTL